MGPNSTQGMDGCGYSVFVLSYVVSGFRRPSYTPWQSYQRSVRFKFQS
jgi:hypothetical protein